MTYNFSTLPHFFVFSRYVFFDIVCQFLYFLSTFFLICLDVLFSTYFSSLYCFIDSLRYFTFLHTKISVIQLTVTLYLLHIYLHSCRWQGTELLQISLFTYLTLCSLSWNQFSCNFYLVYK